MAGALVKGFAQPLVALPRWTRPAVAGADRQLRVVLAAPTEDPIATLHREARTVPVVLGEGRGSGGGVFAYDARLGSGVPPGLYDLVITSGGAHYR